MLENTNSRSELNSKGTFQRADQLLSNDNPSNCCFSSNKDFLDETKLFCCKCAHKRRASPLTCLSICFLVLTYNMIGGLLFYALEGDLTQQTEETSVAASKPNLSQTHVGSGQMLRSRTVERLWSITEDLNILYKENWTKLAAKELMDFQRVLVKTIKGGNIHENKVVRYEDDGDYKWSLSSSFLYALTLITTIGHGNITPKSSLGKMVAIAYACVGIPIIMLYLSTIGDALARNFRIVYSKICPSRSNSSNIHTKADCLNKYNIATSRGCKQKQSGVCEKRLEFLDIYNERAIKRTPFQAALNLDSFKGGYHWTCRDHTSVPIILSLFLIALYIVLGTFVFHTTEKWSLVDGCFFSFSSLSTVGFGDLRPGLYASTISPKSEDIAIGVSCLYILVGIVVVAMCFNLIQEDMSTCFSNFTVLCTGGSKSRVVHSAERVCEESASMSIVS